MPQIDLPPDDLPDEDAAMGYAPDDQADGPAAEALAVFEAEYLGRHGIQGVGLGTDEIGDDALIVYCRHASDAKGLPDRFHGFPVRAEVTGDIDAY